MPLMMSSELFKRVIPVNHNTIYQGHELLNVFCERSMKNDCNIECFKWKNHNIKGSSNKKYQNWEILFYIVTATPKVSETLVKKEEHEHK